MCICCHCYILLLQNAVLYMVQRYKCLNKTIYFATFTLKRITATSNANEFCKDVTHKSSQCYGRLSYTDQSVKLY